MLVFILTLALALALTPTLIVRRRRIRTAICQVGDGRCLAAIVGG